MARTVKIDLNLNGAVRSFTFQTVESLNNQRLLCRPISKIVVLMENELIRFPTKETKKGQDYTIARGESYVEALFSQNKSLEWKDCVWTYCNLSTCECDLFNCRVIKSFTYNFCICLSRLFTQCVREKYKRSNYHCNYQLITKSKF